jgi:hypothetical protein
MRHPAGTQARAEICLFFGQRVIIKGIAGRVQRHHPRDRPSHRPDMESAAFGAKLATFAR